MSGRVLISLLFACLIFSPQACKAQLPLSDQKINYAGKDFWMSLYINPANYSVFFITGLQDANIRFEYTAMNMPQTYFLKAGTTLQVSLNRMEVLAIMAGLFSAEQVLNRSLHITSDRDIVINYANFDGADDDGFVLFPSDNQNYGIEYYLNGPPMQAGLVSRQPGGGFTIVSRCDSTVLEITPSVPTWNHLAGVPFLLTLNKGETYVIVTPDSNSLAGTKVQIRHAPCCNPINVFETYLTQFMYWNSAATGAADQMTDQIFPVSVWDTIYPVIRMANNPYNIITIVSSANNNTVYFDGLPKFTLNKGQKYDTIIAGSVIITADEPVSIVEDMMSQTISWSHLPGIVPVDSVSDPASLWLIPLRDGIKDAYINPINEVPNPVPNAPNQQIYQLNMLTLISKASNINTVRLDGVSIAGKFIPFPGDPDYMYAYVKLHAGQYHLQSQEKIIAYYYAAYSCGSIAFSLGDVSPAYKYVDYPVSKMDTVIMCNRMDITLTAPQADEYLWSDGTTGSSIITKDTGLYYVYVSYNESCNSGFIKTFYVQSVAYAQIILQDTVYTCVDSTVILVADDTADSYLWWNGSDAQQATVNVFGSPYKVVETYQLECRQTSHYFTILPKSKEQLKLNLGLDRYICSDEIIKLPGSGKRTVWSTGEIADSITISKPGIYWASVTDTCYNYTYTDTVIIKDTLCLRLFCDLTFPTAFSPNGDGHNDLFRPVSFGDFSGYHLTVYNRWGERIYQTDRMEKGWPGTSGSMPVDVGVYYYLCSYECPVNGNKIVKGEVTLIK